MTICISVYDNLYSLLGPTGPEGGIDRTEALAKDTFQYAAVCPEIQKYLLRPAKVYHEEQPERCGALRPHREGPDPGEEARRRQIAAA